MLDNLCDIFDEITIFVIHSTRVTDVPYVITRIADVTFSIPILFLLFFLSMSTQINPPPPPLPDVKTIPKTPLLDDGSIPTDSNSNVEMVPYKTVDDGEVCFFAFCNNLINCLGWGWWLQSLRF